MSKALILDTLKTLAAAQDVDIVCLVRKSGDLIASAGNVAALQLETFGIMSATIYGAANTANEHLGKEPPERIVIRSSDGDTVITGVTRMAILVLRTKGGENFSKILNDIDKTVEMLQEAGGI